MSFGGTKQLELETLLVRSELTGSIQRTAAGVPYIVGVSGITVTTSSNGQITLAGQGASSPVPGQVIMPSDMLNYGASDDAQITIGIQQSVRFPSGSTSSVYIVSQAPAGYVTGSHVPVFRGFMYLLNGLTSGSAIFKTSFMRLSPTMGMPTPSFSPSGDTVQATAVLGPAANVTMYHSNSGGLTAGDFFYAKFQRQNDSVPYDVYMSVLGVQYVVTGTTL